VSWTPTPNSSYWVGAAPRPSAGISTSRTELLHLLIAAAVLSFDFALLRSQFTVGSGFTRLDYTSLLNGLVFGISATLTGFVAHEMAHKVTAERYGFWAEFRVSPTGLLLSVITAYIGFLFALPGATVVGGMGDRTEWGKTSLAGPVVNLVEASVFVASALVGAFVFESFTIWSFFLLLAFFNAWFATFNLIPFGLLDGQKVWRWNRFVWVIAFAVSAIFTIAVFLTFSQPFPVG
jgi:Zn-dependent protease